jgi:hypothetical protein
MTKKMAKASISIMMETSITATGKMTNQKGEYKYANGDIYNGDWKNDKKDGKVVKVC